MRALIHPERRQKRGILNAQDNTVQRAAPIGLWAVSARSRHCARRGAGTYGRTRERDGLFLVARERRDRQLAGHDPLRPARHGRRAGRCHDGEHGASPSARRRRNVAAGQLADPERRESSALRSRSNRNGAYASARSTHAATRARRCVAYSPPTARALREDHDHRPVVFSFERMDIRTDFVDAVGNTPLIKLRQASELTGCTILGKAEFANPGGSVKDRAAKYMVLDGERRGVIEPGGLIVEGTAGNTGIGLALVGNSRGYRTLILMPNTQSQ